MKGRIEYTIPAKISSLTQILDGIARLLREQGFPPELTSDVQLAADEAVTNVILHGCRGKEGAIHLVVVATGDMVEVIVEDHGPPFDPTSFVPGEVKEDLMDRRPGGLGIVLIRNVMDEVQYRRDAGKNILTMMKRKKKPGNYKD
jgi:serine/threonine-protein kinase RsbW